MNNFCFKIWYKYQPVSLFFNELWVNSSVGKFAEKLQALVDVIIRPMSLIIPIIFLEITDVWCYYIDNLID